MIAAVLRAVHLWLQSTELPFLGHPVLDAAVYHEWAVAIAQGRPFVTGPYYQSPGYPHFLGGLYLVTGPHPMAGVILQSILGIATVVITALLGKRLFGPREGMIAGAMLLLMAPFYYVEVKLLDVTLSVFLVVVAVLLVVEAELCLRGKSETDGVVLPGSGRRSLVLFAAAGLMAGWLAVVRANLLLFPLALLGWWGVQAVRRRRRLVPVGVYALAVATTLAPTALHNLSHGAAIPIATSGGFNLYLGNFRGATGVFTDVPGTTGSIATQEAEADSLVRAHLGRSLEPAAESQYWTRRTFAEIVDDPLHWLGLVGRKAWLFLGSQEQTNNGSLEMEASRVWFLRVAAIPWNVLFVLGMVGGVFVARGRRGASSESVPNSLWVAPMLLVAATVITCLLFFVLSRLRLPAAPVLAILGAHALVDITRRWRAKAHRPTLAGLVAAMIAFVLVTSHSPLSAGRNPVWEASLVVESAKALDREGHGERAEEAYQLARGLDPGSVDAVLGVAEHAVARGDVETSIALYESARDLAPDRFQVRNNLGILYFSAGRPQECEREMHAALRLDPDQATPYLYLGMVARAKGDSAWSQLLGEALRRDPRQPWAYAALIEGALASGDMESARVWMERARTARVELPRELLGRVP